MTKYKLTVCGGTFDLLHLGHKEFIKDALNSSEKVILGITSNLYTQSFKNSFEIEDFEVRKKAVEQFLDSIGARDRVEIVEIDSAYEPYLETSTDYQAIVVTKQTEKTALDINLKRKQNGISELDVINVFLKLAEDGDVISSTRIRNGEINRDGRLYVNPKWQNKTLFLPQNLRLTLQNPWGEILKDIPRNLDGSKVVVVGDATVQKFNEQNITQFLSIVDFLVQRKVKFDDLSQLGFVNQSGENVKNPPGSITWKLFEAVKQAFMKEKKGGKIILIEGEEDLAVLPVILVSPLGYSVFYGQPGQGMVRIYVTEENKEKAYQLTNNFLLE